MIKFLSWFGTASSIAGAFLMAFGFAKIGYILFSFGSLSWLIVGYNDKNNSLMVLNGTFFIANVIGLYRAFL